MGFENVGRVWTPQSLRSYLNSITKPEWCRAVTLHHTAEPSLAQRPNGLLMRHVENIRDYYRDSKGWSSGPHLFADEDQLFGMCDLRRKGVHAVSFNSSAIGIEVLGNYDQEDPLGGRGLQCWRTAAAATAVLLHWLGLPCSGSTVLFHRDDPKTAKSCPGRRVDKDWLLDMVTAPARVPGSETIQPDLGMDWHAWDFRGERWCVPVLEFLVARGVPPSTVIARLKRKGTKTYYGSELLEGAYYLPPGADQSPNGCTWAPASELLGLLQ